MRRIGVQGGVEDRFDAVPAFAVQLRLRTRVSPPGSAARHAPRRPADVTAYAPAGSMARSRNARAFTQSRSTVRTETPSIRPMSSSGTAPKKRSSTT